MDVEISQSIHFHKSIYYFFIYFLNEILCEYAKHMLEAMFVKMKKTNNYKDKFNRS